MALEFDKLDETCSNVYLIDERLCLKNSYEIFNTNVTTLSGNLNNLQIYCNQYNQLYSNFSSNSARWIRAISNFQTLSAGWFSAETTVKTLSTYWHTDLNVIYNRIIKLEEYYLDEISWQNNIKDWLINNFILNLVDDQNINVDLYLSKNESFTWNYYKKYYESCVPTKQNKPTGGCSCPQPSYNCNHVRVNGQEQNDGACMNAAGFCSVRENTVIGSDVINCPNKNNRDVVLSYNETSFDQNLARVISLKYKKINNTIVKI